MFCVLRPSSGIKINSDRVMIMMKKMSMANEGEARLLKGNGFFRKGERVKRSENEMTNMKITAVGRSERDPESARVKMRAFLNDPTDMPPSSTLPEW